MPVRTRRAHVLLAAATLAEFTAMGLFIAAIPLYVKEELDASTTAAGVAVSVFSITAVLLRPSIGRGVDTIGRRPFVLGALGLLAVSSPLLVLATSVPAVIGVRLLQGAVGGTYYTSSASMATDLSPPERRASAIARFSLFLYIGFAVGPALGEWMIRHHGFDAAWLTGAALGAAGFAAAWQLPETRVRADAAEDPPLARTRRVVHPAAIAPGLVLLSAAVGYSGITAFSSLYARQVGMGSSGTLYAAFAVTIIGVRLASLRLIDHIARRTLVVSGLSLSSAALVVLASFESPTPAVIGVATFGAGFAVVFPTLMAFAVDRVSDHERGETLGSFTAFFDIGAGLGGYVVGTLADEWGYSWAYGIPALLCAAGAVAMSYIARPDRVRPVAESAR